MLRAKNLLRMGRPSWRQSIMSTRHVGSSVLISSSVDETRLAVPRFDTGVMGHLAKGSVFCTHGESVVHVAVCSKSPESSGGSFLPLTVDYKSRLSSLGKIPTTSNRRERHGTDEEILASRVIDRSVRPLFPKDFRDDTQITTTAHAVDGVHDPIVLGVNAASCALLKAGLPWSGPVGCVRVGCVDGELIANPSVEQLKRSSMNLLYTCTAFRTIMVEATGTEIPEPDMVHALRFAHQEAQPVIEAQWEALAATAGPDEASRRRKVQFSSPVVEEGMEELREWSAGVQEEAYKLGGSSARGAFSSGDPEKASRGLVERQARGEVVTAVTARFPELSASQCDVVVTSVMARAFRDNVLLMAGVQGGRTDGRGVNEVRQITANHDVLPVVHGSSFFQRGDTHVLASVTLGPREDARISECLQGGGELTQHFFLHYDFPPYCTGEIGNATSVNRRMIGHGNLAEKAVRGVMPEVSEFPYTVRVVAECTSSSGSSSMATACAASLALMDAGVPVKAAVAGVSVGLVVDPKLTSVTPEDGDQAARESGNWVLLTDILGTEDYYGDMDCKVAGTTKGLTAMQLDIKLPHGMPLLALEQALYKARDGRRHILETMAKDRKGSRKGIKSTAPLAVEIKFDPERKRHLIGPGGEMVRFIESTYDVAVDTSVDGFAYIHGRSHRGVSEAELLVQDLVLDPQEGDNYLAEVIEIKDFGCVVRLTRAQDALLHVSEMTSNVRLRRKGPGELVALGQRLRVQVIGVDREFGTVKVSRKILLQEEGEGGEEDDLRPEVPTAEDRLMAIGTLPTFPIIPPRKWSPEFFLHSVASKDDISAAMEKQSAATVAAELDLQARSQGADLSTSRQNEMKLEHMTLSLEDMVELGEERLKAELRARGGDFRGGVEELAERLLKVVTRKQQYMRKGGGGRK